MSLPAKIKLTKKQIEFVMDMTEITDAQEAVLKFASIMTEEKMSPLDMGTVITKIMEKAKK